MSFDIEYILYSKIYYYNLNGYFFTFKYNKNTNDLDVEKVKDKLGTIYFSSNTGGSYKENPFYVILVDENKKKINHLVYRFELDRYDRGIWIKSYTDDFSIHIESRFINFEVF